MVACSFCAMNLNIPSGNISLLSHYFVSFLYFEDMILLHTRLLLLCVMLCYVVSKDGTRAGYISLLSNGLLSLCTSFSGATSRSTAVLVPASCVTAAAVNAFPKYLLSKTQIEDWGLCVCAAFLEGIVFPAVVFIPSFLMLWTLSSSRDQRVRLIFYCYEDLSFCSGVNGQMFVFNTTEINFLKRCPIILLFRCVQSSTGMLSVFPWKYLSRVVSTFLLPVSFLLAVHVPIIFVHFMDLGDIFNLFLS